MIDYLDASVLVALFTDDAQSVAADRLMDTVQGAVIVSDFAAAELASAVSRKVRTGHLSPTDAQDAFSDFDLWVTRHIRKAETDRADIVRAGSYMRRLDLSLRTPDAIHIAIAQRIGARLATFDAKLAIDAGKLGVPTLSS